MGISSIRCRRWFSEFPTTPLPQPVAKNNHCCYLNIFRSPSLLFFTETESSWVGHLSSRVPDSSLILRVWQLTHCLLSKVKVSTLLSGCHVWECQLEARADWRSGKVDRPRLPARPTAWQPLTAASDCDLLPHSPEVARTLLSRRLRTNCQQLLSLESGIKSENNICARKSFCLTHFLGFIHFFSPLDPKIVKI